jgi:hypothetical protein
VISASWVIWWVLALTYSSLLARTGGKERDLGGIKLANALANQINHEKTLGS